MTELPDVLVMFPQSEPELYEKCISCGNELFYGDTVVIAADYVYCDEVCFSKLALEEGNISKVVAGE